MSKKTDETRDRILKAAWEVLESDAGANVRMSDIAKRAGITRQALYLHFRSRADLLIATSRYVDEAKDIDRRLAPSRTAGSGEERLDRFIEAWGNYIPEIYPMGRALLAVYGTDEAAASAWNDRMRALREGCAAAVAALAEDGRLTDAFSVEDATDVLWAIISLRNWERWRLACGWSQEKYVERLRTVARRVLLA